MSQSIPPPGSQASMQPTSKPKRPLSGYNLFFKKERKRFLLSRGCDPEPRLAPGGKRRHARAHGEIKFTDLVRMMAQKWKNLDDTKKAVFNQQAAVGKRKWEKDVARWKEEEKKRVNLEAEQANSKQSKEDSEIFYCSRTVPLASATQISDAIAASEKFSGNNNSDGQCKE
eukprot:scaffold134450_cov50-Attheya_sp.AAC.1